MGTARAKEQSAGCPGFPRALARIQNAIRIGAPLWNRGNHLATYAIYRAVAAQVVAELVSGSACGSLQGALTQGLARAAEETTPGSAGWDLRHAFDTFVDYVLRGEAPKIYAPRPIRDVTVPFYGEGCAELQTLVRRAEAAFAQGHPAAGARQLAGELRGSGRCPGVAQALDAARTDRDAEAALDRLAAGEPPPGTPGEPAPILRRCVLLPSLLEEIAFALSRSARLAASPPALSRDLRKATERTVDRYGKGGRCPEATRLLREGLAAARQDPDPAATVTAIQRALDRLAKALAAAVPE
jgi:hypothetical protein